VLAHRRKAVFLRGMRKRFHQGRPDGETCRHAQEKTATNYHELKFKKNSPKTISGENNFVKRENGEI